MGQVLHGSARTTEAVRRAIQLRQESVRSLAKRFGVSPTTVQKWRKRTNTADAPMGPKEPRSTVLTPEEEAIVVAFRRHTLLPLDACLYGPQPTGPHLPRPPPPPRAPPPPPCPPGGSPPSSRSAGTPCCRWTTACTACNRRSRT